MVLHEGDELQLLVVGPAAHARAVALHAVPRAHLAHATDHGHVARLQHLKLCVQLLCVSACGQSLTESAMISANGTTIAVDLGICAQRNGVDHAASHMRTAGPWQRRLTWRGAGVAHEAGARCAGYLGQPLRVLVLALATAPARLV